jgi:hypothetical protein
VIQDDDVIRLVDPISNTHWLGIQADERLNRCPPALASESRERLPILAILKCCHNHQLCRQD